MKVFVFAHQDDEIFALPYILDSDKKLFIYLTNGVNVKASEKVLKLRALEAKEVFERHLAVLNAEVIWWGLENSIPEGELHKYVNRQTILEIAQVIRRQSTSSVQLVTTTFEGAHQDHDVAAIFSRELGKVLAVRAIEVSTYPQRFSKVYSFKVMKPHRRNERIQFSRGRALKLAFKLIKGYRTQRITWLGLLYATFSFYAFRTYYSAIPMQVNPLDRCFYETRGRSKQKEVLKYLSSWSS